jgi:hypothetical protein
MPQNGPVSRSVFRLAAVLLFSAVIAEAHVPAKRACAPEPQETPILLDDEVVTCDINPVGDSDYFRFIGTGGSEIRIQVTPVAGAWVCFALFFGTDPTPVVNWICAFGRPGWAEQVVLPAGKTGVYRLRVDEHNNDATASYEVYVQRIRPPGSVPPPMKYGVPVTAQTGYLAETNFHQFNGRAGDTVRVHLAPADGAWFCFQWFLSTDPKPLVSWTCAFGRPAWAELKLPETGNYLVHVAEHNRDSTGRYTITVFCLLGSCSQPPGGFAGTSVRLTGCVKCDPSSIFAARVTANRCSAASELKIWFQLPDKRLVPVGSPHRELPDNCNFDNEVFRGVLPAGPRGSWRICSSLTDLYSSERSAIACRAFSLRAPGSAGEPEVPDPELDEIQENEPWTESEEPVLSSPTTGTSR